MALSKIELELERIHTRTDEAVERIKRSDLDQSNRLNDIERRLRELELRSAAPMARPTDPNKKNAIKKPKKRG